MAIVTLSRHECTQNRLPKVCAFCGAPAHGDLKVGFTWSPRWSNWLLIGAFMTRTMTLRLPLCDPHLQQRRRRNRIFLVTLLAVLGFNAGSFALMVALGRAKSYLPFGLLYAGTGFLIILWFITLLLATRRDVKATRITDRSITLNRVHEAFVAAVLEQRRRDSDPHADQRFGDLRDDFDEETRSLSTD